MYPEKPTNKNLKGRIHNQFEWKVPNPACFARSLQDISKTQGFLTQIILKTPSKHIQYAFHEHVLWFQQTQHRTTWWNMFFIVLFLLNFGPFGFAHELGEQWNENPHLLWLDWSLWQIMEPVQIRILGSQHWNEDVLRLQNLVAAHHLRCFLLPHFRRDFNLGTKMLRPARVSFPNI